MWALIVFTVFVSATADMWQIDRGTSTVIHGYTSKESCESAGREFKTDDLAKRFVSTFEERQQIRLKHRFQCVEVK